MALKSSALVASGVDDDKFDPLSPLEVYVVHPVWTTTPADLARIGQLSYDRSADMFFVKRSVDYRGGVAVEARDERFARYVIADMETDVVVAMMIEGFLTKVVKEVPALFDELERAKLRGITIDEIRELRRQLTAEGHGVGPTLAEFYSPESWSEPVVSGDA